MMNEDLKWKLEGVIRFTALFTMLSVIPLVFYDKVNIAMVVLMISLACHWLGGSDYV